RLADPLGQRRQGPLPGPADHRRRPARRRDHRPRGMARRQNVTGAIMSDERTVETLVYLNQIFLMQSAQTRAIMKLSAALKSDDKVSSRTREMANEVFVGVDDMIDKLGSLTELMRSMVEAPRNE